MGKTTQGSFRVPGGFKIQNPFPVDDRMTVETDSVLTDENALPDVYEGIVVYSKSSKAHYTWTEGSRSLFQNWKTIGGEYSANDGVKLENKTFKADNSVVRTSGNQFINGIKTMQNNLRLNNDVFLVLKKSNNTITRTHGINTGNIEYIGSIDSSVNETRIGNNTSKVSLRTSNFDRLTIDNLGDVKILKKLDVSGNVSSSGNITAQTFSESSLRKLKENIKNYKSSGLEKVNNLKIVTFNKIDGAKNKIGVIADDTDKDFLTEEKNAVDLYKTLFVQAKAIQELDFKIEKQSKEIQELKKLVNKLCR